MSWQRPETATLPAGMRAQARPAPIPTRPARVRGAPAPRPEVRPAPPADVVMVSPEEVSDDPRALRPGDRVAGAWDHPYYQLDPALYGLATPPGGGRWIRYFEGALLVDPSGSVLDTRWDLPEPVAPARPMDGVPAYTGGGDYRPGPGDYARRQGEVAPAGPPAMMVIETTTTTTRRN